MRHLYRITVVNPKTEKAVTIDPVVAEDRSQALLKANLSPEVRSNPDKYDIIIEELGSIRSKREVQKVVISKEEED